MTRAITGIHHVSIKPDGMIEFERTVAFYSRILGLKVIREWGDEKKKGAMLDTGAGIIEINSDGEGTLPMGAIRHFALATSQVDELIERVRDAGYKITVEPRDAELPLDPPYRLRIAFFEGPAGELVELFHEK